MIVARGATRARPAAIPVHPSIPAHVGMRDEHHGLRPHAALMAQAATAAHHTSLLHAQRGKTGPRMRRMLAWGGLVLALLVGAAVRWTVPEAVQDLRPRPDALEYEEAARALADGDGYCLQFDGACWPPRYPPGFSLLLVPAMWLTGGEVGGGIWTVLAWALAGIAGVWALGLATGGPLSAGAAALLLALAPLHVRWSRAVMSDVPSATALTLLALGSVRLLSGGARPRSWWLLGAAMGLAALLRSTCTLVAAPVLLALAAQWRTEPATTQRLLAFAAGLAAGFLPSALYGLVRFGSPLMSGYDYWVAADFFAWSNVVDRPAGGGVEPNLIFYLRQLAGMGTLYPWTVALLAATGLALGCSTPGPARQLAWVSAGTVLALVVVHIPFFWQWDRFLLPALPLVLALAGLPVGTLAPAALRLAGVGLVGLALAGAWLTPAAFSPPDRPLGETAALRAIAAEVEPNAALLSHGDVLLVARLFRGDTDRMWVPLGRCEHRQLVRTLHRTPVAQTTASQTWLWDVLGTHAEGGDVEGIVRLLSAAGRPVYFAPILSHQTPLVQQTMRQLSARFALESVPTRPPTGLMRVRPRES